MKIEITGSKAHRVWKCPASAVLPQIDTESDGFEPARGKGHAIHAFLERVKAIGFDEALLEAPEELWPLLKAIDLDNLPVGLATEVAFAWNWKAHTARELGRNLNRQYHLVEHPPDPTCEVPCTLDVIGVQDGIAIRGADDELIRAPRRGYVGDYKSGHVKYPAPDKFAQLLLGALCARSVYGLDDCVLELIHIHDDGDHHKVRRTVDEWDLDAFDLEFTAAMELVDYYEQRFEAHGPSAVSVHQGPHCDYCPAYKQCPAKVALVKAIPAELKAMGIRPGANPETGEATLELTPAGINVRNASEIWMTIELIEDVLARAKQEICGIASFEDIPLPDGRVIGLLETSRRVIDGRIGAEVLLERYGAEDGRNAVDEAVELKLSMDALKKAVVKRKRPDEKIQSKHGTGVFDRVLKAIEDRGGIATNTTSGIKPHVPKKRLKSG